MSGQDGHVDEPVVPAGVRSSELNELREKLIDARREQGRVASELLVAEEKLAAAHLDRRDWDRLSAELGEQLRQTQERLDAIEQSTTWRISQHLLTPYRWMKRMRGG